MSKIIKILGREVIDSRGYPTVESDVFLDDGSIGTSIVPSGASTGINEAIELRDNDINRFCGKGVMKSVFIINNIISKELIGLNSFDQENIDNIMIKIDGTKNKSKLGANSILSVSLSVAKASAKSKGIPLYLYINKLFNKKNKNKFIMPVPMMNIINGGCHADNSIDIQEFMIQPIRAKSIRHSIRIGSEIFHKLGEILKLKNKRISIGDEGGYAPDLSSNEEAICLIIESIKKSGYIPGYDVFICLDCASSEFYNLKEKKYYLKNENKKFSSLEFIEYLNLLVNKYPILSIEDALSEIDFDGFINITKKLGKKIQLVGDDLFVTNYSLLKKGIKLKIANSILIKPNQIGTLTETLKTIKLAKKYGYSVIISHRSGETEDTTIADLSVGVNSGQIKTGSISRSERVSKYNRLIRIEEELKGKSIYRGYKEFSFIKKINN